MRREDWLLDHSTTMSVIACGDPAESLARHARVHGETVLHFLSVGVPEGEAFRYPIPDMTIEHYARAAWRYAAAALVLLDTKMLHAYR